MRHALFAVVLGSALVGCTSARPSAPHDAHHPANPAAAGPMLPMHQHGTPAASQPAAMTHRCPMHTDQTADHAMDCPKCGMKMTPATQPGGHDGHH